MLKKSSAKSVAFLGKQHLAEDYRRKAEGNEELE